MAESVPLLGASMVPARDTTARPARLLFRVTGLGGTSLVTANVTEVRTLEHFPPRAKDRIKPADAKGWSNRSANAQGRFSYAVRKRVRDASGYLHCERCGRTGPLDAHHTQPGNDDPSTGVLLCSRCHCIVDKHARPR